MASANMQLFNIRGGSGPIPGGVSCAGQASQKIVR